MQTVSLPWERGKRVAAQPPTPPTPPPPPSAPDGAYLSALSRSHGQRHACAALLLYGVDAGVLASYADLKKYVALVTRWRDAPVSEGWRSPPTPGDIYEDAIRGAGPYSGQPRMDRQAGPPNVDRSPWTGGGYSMVQETAFRRGYFEICKAVCEGFDAETWQPATLTYASLALNTAAEEIVATHDRLRYGIGDPITSTEGEQNMDDAVITAFECARYWASSDFDSADFESGRFDAVPRAITEKTSAAERPSVLTSPPARVTDDDLRQAIKGTTIEIIINEFQAVTNPRLALAATFPKALALIGCALSGERENPRRPGEMGCSRARVRINTAGGQVPNFYVLTVAESGSGKDIGGRAPKHAIRENWHIGTAGSAEGLADALIGTPSGLLEIQELQNYLDPRHWQGKATPFLTSAFSQGYFKAALSGRTGQAVREAFYCYPNIIGNVQPAVLKACGSTLAFDSGFLARFLITYLEDSDSRPSCVDFSSLAANSQAALEQFKKLEGTVTVEDDYMRETFDMFSKSNAPFRPHWKRLINEYGPRLALVLSVCPNDKSTTARITADGWKRADIAVRWFYKHASRALGTLDGNPQTARLEMIMGRIHRYICRKKGQATQRDIAHNCGKGTTAKERREAMVELQDRGRIMIELSSYSYFSLKDPDAT